MSKIKSKWTSSEKKVHNYLKGNKVKHIMHPKLPGNPDVLLKNLNAVVFIDGCFWHNCPLHGHIPESNISYWKPKLINNVKRDLKSTDLLKKLGFKVFRVWEHEINSKEFGINNVLYLISHLK